MRFPSPIRFLADRRGNVAMMYALMLPVLIFGAGFAIDYTHAMQIQTKLDAAADAAVLAGLTPSMMQLTGAAGNTAAQTAVTNLFNAEAAAIPSLAQPLNPPTVNVCKPTACASGTRTITLTYSDANQNMFSGILGAATLPVTGSSTATASNAPNINFYLLLDNSPSMALPATSTGIATMEGLTPAQTAMQHTATSATAGCAFACHQYQGNANNGDTAGNPCLNGATYTTPSQSAKGWDGNTYKNVYCGSGQGTQIDNYALAKYNNIPLRLDYISTAISDMMTAATNAQQAAVGTRPDYEFAAYTMDTSWQIGMVNTTSVTSSSTPSNLLMKMTTNSGYVSAWQTANPNLSVMQYYANNEQCGSAACNTNGGGGDWATDLDGVLTTMNSTTIMPNPGNGTNVAGDKPQAVLFIITDGVSDVLATSCASESTQSGGTGGKVRCYQPINVSLCQAIQNRGIRIAILYTDYLPVTVDTWYNTYIGTSLNVNPPTNSEIATQLQACASPGLFYDAGVDSSNLGADLVSLFNSAVATANLTQ
jgi:Flp pilus assembly protein TadG